MSTEDYDWLSAFSAIEGAMARAASQRSAEVAGLEAERHGLTMQGDLKATYQDKIWEKVAGDVSLRLRWHCYDPSHAYRAMRDVNVLSLELMQGDKIIKRANEHRFED